MAEELGPEMPTSVSRLLNVVLSEETVETVLELVAHLAASIVGNADGAGAAVLRLGRREATSVATSEEVRVIDRRQYEVGRGPGVEALRDGLRSNITLGVGGSHWPELVTAARDEGFRSLLAVPLRSRDRTIGALSLYSRTEGAFGQDEVRGAEAVARQAGALLASSLLLEARHLTNDQLQEGLETRGIIGQAQGILMVRHGCSSADAFTMLREASQAANRKLSHVARELVENQGRGGSP